MENAKNFLAKNIDLIKIVALGLLFGGIAVELLVNTVSW
jgi:hypothetical protein